MSLTDLPFAKRDVWFTPAALTARAQITSAGREARGGADHYDWLGLQRGGTRFVALQYTLSGSGRLRWGREEFTLDAGSLMVLTIPHDHRYWLPPGNSWDFAWLCLVGDDPFDACRTLHAAHGPVIHPQPQAPVITALLAAVRAVLIEQDITAYRSSALAYTLAMGLYQEAADPGVLSRRHAGICRAAEVCQQRYAESLGVAELARIAGLSRHHFTRRFTAAFGEAPSDYLTRVRIRQAVAHLRRGDQVKDVAHACGFHDATHFCKVFRKIQGMSPGAFRDSGMFQGESGSGGLGELQPS